MDMVHLVYRLTEGFPKKEEYRLIPQLTRAAVSVPANIAEGQARSTSRDFANFLAIAKGSLMETETLVMIAVRLGYPPESQAREALDLIEEISKMLTALRTRIGARGARL
jgi:four helix bundle protein